MKNKVMNNEVFKMELKEQLENIQKNITALTSEMKTAQAQEHWNLEDASLLCVRIENIGNNLVYIKKTLVEAARKASGQYTQEGCEALLDSINSLVADMPEYDEEYDDFEEVEYVSEAIKAYEHYRDNEELYYFEDVPEGEEISDCDFTNRYDVAEKFW